MIYFLTFKQHRYTVSLFIDYTKTKNIKVVGYEDLDLKLFKAHDTVVFSDIDRCNDPKLETLKHLYDQIVTIGCKILNNPHKVMRRFELVNELSKLKYNCFRLYRPQEADVKLIKYPVFLRDEFEHSGPSTELIQDQEELKVSFENIEDEGIVITEFVDTSVDSLFHKFGAFIIDGEIIPRHYFVSDKWNVKSSSSITEESIRNEISYLETNPDKELIQKIASIAHIDYGRIDYAFFGQQIIVFEINTNPTLIDRWDIIEDDLRFPVTTQFIDSLTTKINSMTL
jgi:hypothetical protein